MWNAVTGYLISSAALLFLINLLINSFVSNLIKGINLTFIEKNVTMSFNISTDDTENNLVVSITPLSVAQHILKINKLNFNLPVVSERITTDGIEVVFDESVDLDTLNRHLETFSEDELNKITEQ
ncbi:MAG: hypothetical protein ACJAXS_001348 [Colwellia sp.]